GTGHHHTPGPARSAGSGQVRDHWLPYAASRHRARRARWYGLPVRAGLRLAGPHEAATADRMARSADLRVLQHSLLTAHLGAKDVVERGNHPGGPSTGDRIVDQPAVAACGHDPVPPEARELLRDRGL